MPPAYYEARDHCRPLLLYLSSTFALRRWQVSKWNDPFTAGKFQRSGCGCQGPDVPFFWTGDCAGHG
eukprot:scaffold207_cov345-Pavlova_lutheri.AAC.3